MKKFKMFLASSAAAVLMVGCAGIDPSLPGQSKPAPFLAFTNGSAYLLGHPVNSNQVYSATLSATQVGVGLLEKEDPSVTNYLGDVQLTFNFFATSTFSQSALTQALAPTGLDNANQELLDSIASTALSLAGTYVTPLMSSDTNSMPFVKAALHGIADGL